MRLLLVLTALSLCSPSQASSLQLPNHFAVPVRTTVDLKPTELRVGDSLSLVVSADLHLDGCLVFREGTPVVAVVTESHGPGPIGRASLVVLDIRSSLATDGSMIPLSGSMRAEGEDRSVESLGTTLEFCCLGIFIPGGRQSIGKGVGTVAVTTAAMEVQCQGN